MTPSFCFDAVMLRLAPNRPFFEGWGPNYIHPQTCFSDFRFAPKASFETPGGYASLAARKETSASRPHPPPKPENGNDKRLWKFPHNMSVNQFYQRPCRTRKQFLCLRSRNGFIRVRL